jgi:hypothetical protein
MAHKRHYDYAHRLESFCDLFDACYLPRLKHFSPGAVEKRVTAHLRRIQAQIEKAGCNTGHERNHDEIINP